MELHQAEKIAKELEAELSPLCHKFEIAGSIRRRRPFVHDNPWFRGSYGFTLESPEMLVKPIPYRGMLKFFEVTDAEAPALRPVNIPTDTL